MPGKQALAVTVAPLGKLVDATPLAAAVMHDAWPDGQVQGPAIAQAGSAAHNNIDKTNLIILILSGMNCP